jgi:hypothetical protein
VSSRRLGRQDDTLFKSFSEGRLSRRFRRLLRRQLLDRHRQLNDLRQVHPFRSIGSGTRGACDLAPDSEGLSSRRAMISGIGSCRTAEEVCNLVVN